MPTFGEFETEDEPLASVEEGTQITTVWKARRSGGRDARRYVIKCYAPRRRAAPETRADDTLDRDRGLEFLDSIKQLKKIQGQARHCLSPIHELGINELGAWYATDYYAGHDLKFHIEHRGSVSSAALRHIVHNVVTGCLALKRLRGYSHGNLKASNVFLASLRPLRRAPLLLTDVYPASPAQVASLETEDRQNMGRMIEAHDLLEIGRLVLQLIEGRLLARTDDHRLWDLDEERWSQLGKERDYWRGWYQKLVSMDLHALATVNLEALEREFRPNPVAERMPLILAVAGGACVAGVLLVVGLSVIRHAQERRAKQHQEALSVWTNRISSAVRSLEEANYISAESEFNAAAASVLKWKEPDKSQVAAQGLELTLALERADKALKVPDYEEAEQALKQYQEAARVSRLLAYEAITKRAADGENLAKEQVSRRNEKKYEDLISAAGKLLQATNYAEAAVEFEKAVALAVGLNDADRRKKADEGQRFAGELARAKSAERVEERIGFLEAALKVRQDAYVEQWLRRAREERSGIAAAQVLKQKKKELGDSIAKGEGLLSATNYAEAVVEFQKAVTLAAALNDADKRKQAEEGQRFAGELANAKSAERVEDQIRFLEAALKVRKDAKVEQWLAQADQRKGQITATRTRQQQEKELDDSIAKGEGLLRATNYAEAAVEFQRAATLATALNDAAKRKQADQGQRFAGELARAKAAGQVEDRIGFLEAALKVRQDAKVQEWLQQAREEQKRIAAAKGLELRKKELGDSIAKGEGLLRGTNYAEAAVEFQNAVRLAAELKDADKRKQAEEGQRFAGELAKAKSAQRVEDRIGFLEAALKVRKDTKVEQWLAEARGQRDQLDREQAVRRDVAELTKVMAEGSNYLAQANYLPAAQWFERAEGLAKKLNDTLKQDAAGRRLSFARALIAATDLSTTNSLAAFQKATNALAQARGILSAGETGGATKLARGLAEEACRAAIKDGNDTEASGWLALARDHGTGEQAFKELKTEIDQLASGPHRPANVNLLGVPFIWVRSLRSNSGAYVAQTELSQAQFKSLLPQDEWGSPKMTKQPFVMHVLNGTDQAAWVFFSGNDKPMLLTYDGALAFCESLNKDPVKLQGLPVKGRFELPTRLDFLLYSEVSSNPVDGAANPEFGSLTSLFTKAAARIRATAPVAVTAGPANAFRLNNVLGNAWEWCLDSNSARTGVAAGFSYRSAGVGTSKYLFSATPPPNDLTGVRLLFVPAGQ